MLKTLAVTAGVLLLLAGRAHGAGAKCIPQNDLRHAILFILNPVANVVDLSRDEQINYVTMFFALKRMKAIATKAAIVVEIPGASLLVIYGEDGRCYRTVIAPPAHREIMRVVTGGGHSRR